MMLIHGEKFACEACFRGHRVSSCDHKGSISQISSHKAVQSLSAITAGACARLNPNMSIVSVIKKATQRKIVPIISVMASIVSSHTSKSFNLTRDQSLIHAAANTIQDALVLSRKSRKSKKFHTLENSNRAMAGQQSPPKLTILTCWGR